jgi:hypothetical protein
MSSIYAKKPKSTGSAKLENLEFLKHDTEANNKLASIWMKKATLKMLIDNLKQIRVDLLFVVHNWYDRMSKSQKELFITELLSRTKENYQQLSNSIYILKEYHKSNPDFTVNLNTVSYKQREVHYAVAHGMGIAGTALYLDPGKKGVSSSSDYLRRISDAEYMAIYTLIKNGYYRINNFSSLGWQDDCYSAAAEDEDDYTE